jgi:hypothetical protein
MLALLKSLMVNFISYTHKAQLKTMKMLILVQFFSISVLVENKHDFFHSFELLRSYAERCNNSVIDLTKLDLKLLFL